MARVQDLPARQRRRSKSVFFCDLKNSVGGVGHSFHGSAHLLCVSHHVKGNMVLCAAFLQGGSISRPGTHSEDYAVAGDLDLAAVFFCNDLSVFYGQALCGSIRG